MTQAHHEISHQALLEENERLRTKICELQNEIADHVQTRDVLKMNLQRVRFFARNVPNSAIFMFASDLSYIIVDGIALRREGFDPETMTGKTVFDYLSGDPLQEVLPLYYEALAGRTLTLSRTHNERSYVETAFPIQNDEGEILAGVIIAQDITDKKQAEDALRMSEQKYRTLVETFDDLIYSCDAEGRFTFVNRNGALRIHGYEPEEMIGRNFVEFLKEELTEADRQTHADLIAGKSVYGYETIHVRKDGSLVHLSFNAVPMRDEQGNIIGTMGMATDITERKNLIAQLTQAQKMETVGRLAGGVAHDFNNLLTVIMGFTELAENDISDREQVQHSLQQVRIATNRAASLTKQLLAFARKQMMHLHTVQINDVLSSLNVMMERLIPENILVSLNLSPGLPLVLVDRHQLEQVLINLMVNARDAMPGGGQLMLTTDRVAINAESAKAIPEMLPGEYVRVSVTDTGQGIPSEVRLKIFEPFFTTKELGKGTGLGLSVCEGILRQHGGYIQVESEVGEGTTFYLYLPPARK